MSHDQESRDLTVEKAIESMGGVLGGLGSLVETAERIITSLHLIAKSVQSMEEDGSLSRLAEFLQKAEQAKITQGDDSLHHGKGRDQDNA
mgnify:CR=1 FL=1